MKHCERKSFFKRLERDPMSITEEEIHRIKTTQWIQNLKIRNAVFTVGALLMFVIFSHFLIFTIAFLYSAVFISGPNRIMQPQLFAACGFLFALYMMGSYRFFLRMCPLGDLNLLIQEHHDFCQEAVDLCVAVPEACRIRDDLVAAGRPLRVFHLRFMRTLDKDGAVAKMVEAREEQAKERSCKALHGV